MESSSQRPRKVAAGCFQQGSSHTAARYHFFDSSSPTHDSSRSGERSYHIYTPTNTAMNVSNLDSF
jgi:hypothetical protein